MNKNTKLQWHYGPTATDSDPGKMWCYACGSEVLSIDSVYICGECKTTDYAIETLSITGHRPQRCGGFGKEALDKLIEVAKVCLTHISPMQVAVGMALGWDTAVAMACVELGIPFVAYVPFSGQELLWSDESQVVYNDLLEKAREVIYVSEPPYHPSKMIKRNNAMMSAGDGILALFDGEQHGGTAQAVNWATKHGKLVWNAWNVFQGNGTEPEMI